MEMMNRAIEDAADFGGFMQKLQQVHERARGKFSNSTNVNRHHTSGKMRTATGNPARTVKCTVLDSNVSDAMRRKLVCDGKR